MEFEVSSTSSYRSSVTKQIRQMIEKYNADSLLKEFLQNADDAKASRLTVALDLRNHGSFKQQALNIATGPALVISNDALFNDQDFKAIDQIMDGGKVDKAQSTGRFGQGFTSSFSISDHPSLISGGMRHGTSKWFDAHKSAVCKELDDEVATWKHDEVNSSTYERLEPWLRTFLLPGEEDTVGRTVFRLPLRTSETAKTSEISRQIFTEQRFYNWCDEWRKSSDNLLFLRNVHTLILCIVHENGKTQELLKIETKNIEEIKSVKQKLNKTIPTTMSPQEICQSWLSNNIDLPTVTYEHEFQCNYFDRSASRTESVNYKWAVVNGLFKGTDSLLLKQALKFLGLGPNFRKVLPWAGVAIPIGQQIPKNDDMGQFFTFLPLGIRTKSKAHMQGWFELDDKRTSIVLKAGNDDQTPLVKWNLMLAEHAIGKAWAELLLEYKHNLSETDYYEFWPNFSKDSDEITSYIQKGFYTRMAKAECLKVWHKDSYYWAKPSIEHFYCSRQGKVAAPTKELKKIVQNELKLIFPEPPSFVISNLRAFGGIISEFTPDVLIDAVLERSRDLIFPQEEYLLSDLFFASKQSVSHVLKYSLLGTLGVSGVDGLPLQYCLDGKLHRIQDLSLFSTGHDLSLFKNDKSKFVDQSIYDLDLREMPITWLSPTLENKLKILSQMMSLVLVDLDWFDELVELIRRSGESERQTDRVRRLLVSLPVYKNSASKPTTLNELRSVGKSTYLELKSENREYYEMLGVCLFDKHWVQSYQRLHDLLGPSVSPLSIITNEVILVEIANMNQSVRLSLEDQDFRHFVLKSIGRANKSHSDYKSLIHKIKNHIPLALTQNGSLTSINGRKASLYLPGGFKVDKSLAQISDLYDLVHSGEQKFFDVFEKLDVSSMSFSDYIENVVVKHLNGSSDIESKIRLLEWLCNELESVRNDPNVIKLLTSASFVPAANGSFLRATEVYAPNFFGTLPESIKATAKKLRPFQNENWNKLLELCGAQKTVSIKALHQGAIYISQRRDVEEAFNLVSFIKRHLPEFENAAKQCATVHKDFSGIPWIPCVQGKNVVDGKENADLQLGSPKSITLQTHKYKLCPSFNLLAPKIEHENQKERTSGRDSLSSLYKFLGLETFAQTRDQIRNYQKLIGTPINHSNERFLFNASTRFYAVCGREKELRYEDKPEKILINREWVQPKNVFFRRVSGLPGLHSVEDFLGVLKHDQTDVTKGLEKLGVRTGPSKEFLIDYLTLNLGLDRVLNSDQVLVAKSALSLLQKEHLQVINKWDEVPLLTTNGKLCISSKVFLDEGDDLVSASSKNEYLRVCVGEFTKLAAKTNAKSIKYDSEMSIKNDETEFLSPRQVPDDIAKFSRKLKTNWFENAVRRLAFHNLKSPRSEVEQSYKDRLIPDRITMCKSLTLSCNIGLQWIYDTNRQKVFNRDGELYVVLGSTRVLCEALASYVSNEFSLNTESSIMIATLVKDIESEEEANEYLGEEKGIPELPNETKFNQRVFSHDFATVESDVVDLIEADLDEEDYHTEDSAVSDEPRTIPVGVNNNVGEIGDVGLKPSKIKDEVQDPWEQTRRLDAHLYKSEHKERTVKSGISSNQGKTQDSSKVRTSSEQIEKGNLGDLTYNAPSASRSKSRSPAEKLEIRKLDVGHRDYVSHNRKSGMGTAFTGNQTTLLGDDGENNVLNAIEKSLPSGHKIVKAPKNNPGYDLLEIDVNDAAVRKIEVKTLPAGWGERGVKLSRTQVELALIDPTWSLIVVVGQNTSQATFLDLGNPFNKVKSYFLPNAWNQELVGDCVEILPLIR
ncbi:sacsin N-terminal ATP-binding-like domain-containing protein [Vibrio alfacsensis]|uniref:sacsin N-terminal ATP-binding-like domain-containing protein n=1 Tax=Vibrio alfacsensis TaxID=1074311 RepID=UPI001BEF7E17|nr:hypothetical protein [Vibrio alfacsensis]BCN26110.1 hypothetical protein VYA_33020 [Vibrio alfacsensis]